MKLHVVPAGAGFGWAVLGIKNFLKQPVALGGLFFLFLGLIAITSLVPILGTALALALLPAITLGLMEATQLAEKGIFPMPSVLLTALRAEPARRRQMAFLGALYAAGFLLIMGITALFDGGQFARLYLLGGEITQELLTDSDFQLASWVSLALYLPLSLLFWHAPALTHWQGLGAVQSMFYSFVACMKNFWALSVFGLVWVGLLIGLLILVTTVAALSGSPKLVTVAIVPVSLTVAALFFMSTFFTYRDSFIFDDPTPTEGLP
ncbi:MAG: BPSS1780 family membrane protein [Burkholderiaceae bacterium]